MTNLPWTLPKTCNGVADANGNIQHDDYTACPACDTIADVTLNSFLPRDQMVSRLRKGDPHLASTRLEEAAKYIELQGAEIDRLKALGLSLDEYQTRCGDTANYPEAGTGSITAITYCVLGLAGEAGEVADKWKKVLRGDHGEGVVPQEIKDLMVKEVGDTTWYAARLSIELGVALSKVAQGNIDKLASRQARGVIKGSGDMR